MGVSFFICKKSHTHGRRIGEEQLTLLLSCYICCKIYQINREKARYMQFILQLKAKYAILKTLKLQNKSYSCMLSQEARL